MLFALQLNSSICFSESTLCSQSVAHFGFSEYKQRLNNEMVHTEIKKDDCPIYAEAQVSHRVKQCSN